jgi:SAM-dependent methyltransferase
VIDLVRRLDEQQRAPQPEETALLALWRGWGTVAAAFTGRGTGDPQWTEIRAAVEQRLTPRELAAAIAGIATSYFTDLGFAGGRVLETGCGTGAFMAATPAGVAARWTGIEPDSMAARIAALRFPDAEIVVKELQDVPLPDGSYDLAIGNVPFSNPDTHDSARTGGFSLHNYCLWRALQALRPGGLVVAITSRYTLDASSPQQRDRLAELGDLVEAIRLPSGAFSAAGTAVVTDIVAFRRRGPGAAVKPGAWRAVTTAMVRAVPVNEYFARRPELVLGRPTVRPGRYGFQLGVEPTGSMAAALHRATRHVVASAGVASLRRAQL